MAMPAPCKYDLVTVDLSVDRSILSPALVRGCSDGFFYVSNHGVPQMLIDAAFAASRAFFALPQAAKAALTPTAAVMTSGYRASGSVCVGAKGQSAPESREIMRFAATDCDITRHPQGWPAPALELLAGPAADGVPLWPAEAAASTINNNSSCSSCCCSDECQFKAAEQQQLALLQPPDAASASVSSSNSEQQQAEQEHQVVPAGFKATLLAYFAAVNGVAEQLLRGAAAALGLSEDALIADDMRATCPAWQTLSLLHYPASASAPEEGQFAAAPHKDRFCMLTMLANTPGSRGLEALTADGTRWFEVLPKPGCFIVNVGSLLELWSGGRFPASVHRVVNYDGAERYSIAFFRGNAPDTLVQPLLPPLHEGDDMRAAESGVAPRDCTTQYKPVLFGDYIKGFNAAFSMPVIPSQLAPAEVHTAA